MYYKNSDSLYSSSAITNGNTGSVSGTNITLSATTLYNGNIYLKIAQYVIGGTTMAFNNCYEVRINSTGGTTSPSTTSSAISVTTVVGYNQPFAD